MKNLLHDERINSGEFMWHGDDTYGKALANGLYFVVLRDEKENTKIMCAEKVIIQR